MKITAVRLLRLSGTVRTEGALWEERQVRPIDIYPEYRTRHDFEGGQQTNADSFRVVQYFVRVETDEGPIGIAGPLPETVAFIVARRLRPILLGQDPIAHEKLWDQMHRIMVHGRQGDAMLAISAVDCALWDLKGRWLSQPIFRLLGGPTRDAMPAYASMLGFDVLDMGRVRERAAQYRNAGFAAQKWFFRHGPTSGPEGMRKNIELVRTLRTALGEDYDIMLDCWQSFDPSYAIELAERIDEYRPRWLEECVMPDRIDSYRRVKESTNIPLAGAEHEYTRWGFKRFVDAGTLDILQPDIYWAGGLSETLKIAAYASVHDLTVIPHGHSSPIGIHFSLAQSPLLTPVQEYLVKWNTVNQHFLAEPVTPTDGMFAAPRDPGVGMDLDPSKIETQEEAFA
ncbi:MAG: mandelate racemase/muconate lactonizing protein [Pseudomonadota bacterium]|nr:mandelate racemase/muconate lactonizing protein [Pseudomonadota bacterium]